MKIKVCGITTAEQANRVSKMSDYIGFIFYAESLRCTPTSFPVSKGIKTGVFVNESLQEIIHISQMEKLDAVQLHGNETPEYCASLRQLTVIKAFGIDEDFDFQSLENYSEHVDYFLFDTKTPGHGGSGKTFDWNILNKYNLNTPFFLSGGLNPNSIEQLKEFKHPMLYGIDLNSGFEVEPGLKNIELIKTFIDAYNNELCKA